jgi:uncharacterized membrane protein YqjE
MAVTISSEDGLGFFVIFLDITGTAVSVAFISICVRCSTASSSCSLLVMGCSSCIWSLMHFLNSS